MWLERFIRNDYSILCLLLILSIVFFGIFMRSIIHAQDVFQEDEYTNFFDDRSYVESKTSSIKFYKHKYINKSIYGPRYGGTDEINYKLTNELNDYFIELLNKDNKTISFIEIKNGLCSSSIIYLYDSSSRKNYIINSKDICLYWDDIYKNFKVHLF